MTNTPQDIANSWAMDFGLALAPLFGPIDRESDGEHFVLLDGGNGSFALSISNDKIWRNEKSIDWAWSSDLSHHVTMTESEVGVVRWDKPNPEVFTRKSVEEKRPEFYRFLTADRIKSNRRVVTHIVDSYRRMRSLVADAGLPDDHSTGAFLALLSEAITQSQMQNQADQIALVSQLEIDKSALDRVSQTGRESLLRFLLDTDDFYRNITLYPALAVRHAGSEIFQEAHYELFRSPRPDLFDHIGPAKATAVSRGGAHFTPPALARSLVEETFRQVPNIITTEKLTIIDPACGSGAFLHEALRTLQRLGFEGRVKLVGIDYSHSAIEMAKFVLQLAALDWSPGGGVELDLRTSDSLANDLPPADIVLMNPPFVAWSAMTRDQRTQMSEILKGNLGGRGDYSMAFVAKAVACLKPNGVLGTLMPNSLLSLQSAQKWREWLAAETDICFIGALGDYGLFSYATVQVAALVARKPELNSKRELQTRVLVAANDPEATSMALRQLRKSSSDQSAIAFGKDFRLFETARTTFSESPTWRLLSPATEDVLAKFNSQVGLARLEELFQVRQGIQTGMNPAFVLSLEQLQKLPSKERKWFKPALMNETIFDGRLKQKYYIFYPYDEKGELIASEAKLKEFVPIYASHYLYPNRERLANRASIKEAKRSDWWGLMRSRASWAFDSSPRIVSKRFAGLGGFAVDLDAEWFVVQGFVWFPKWLEANNEQSNYLSAASIVAAYSAIFNSRPFLKLLSLHSPHVAGGQFDLSPRYVNSIPIPDIPSIAQSEIDSKTINQLTTLGMEPQIGSASWQSKVDRLTNQLYGVDLLALD
ncbi:class I SAM-dependent DNA methyltransferase [Hyphomonas sp.]|uniref:HsdM family class I SAM-dependent methyltransferase n=1 Tax=Hyphomonas sp. TaxID=87 RepID=UPI003526DE9D